MLADKFSLDKYIVKKRFPAKYIIFSEQGEKLFVASKPWTQKKILICDSAALSSPLLTVSWKYKKGLVLFKYEYTILDRGHSPVAYMECERSLFSVNLNIKDLYNQPVGTIQSDQIACYYKSIDITLNITPQSNSALSPVSPFMVSSIGIPT